jgi:hypothetical protein
MILHAARWEVPSQTGQGLTLATIPKRPLKKGYVRDEGVQTRELTEMLSILDREGVEGTFVFAFSSPTNP